MSDTPYILLVALGGDKPDMSTLKGFLVSGVGINYNEGVWQYISILSFYSSPMIATKAMKFLCLVHEGTIFDVGVD